MKKLSLWAALLLLAGLAQAADNAQIEIVNAYARAVPPNAPNSAAFMLIHNHSNQDRALVSAESDVSEITELHNHINDEGVMRMRQVSRIEIPAQGTAELQPGSFHVMLIGLKQPLKEEDKVMLKLTFDDNSQKTLVLEARKLMHKPMHDHHEHGEHHHHH